LQSSDKGFDACDSPSCKAEVPREERKRNILSVVIHRPQANTSHSAGNAHQSKPPSPQAAVFRILPHVTSHYLSHWPLIFSNLTVVAHFPREERHPFFVTQDSCRTGSARVSPVATLLSIVTSAAAFHTGSLRAMCSPNKSKRKRETNAM
jgi:hypothetical protein